MTPARLLAIPVADGSVASALRAAVRTTAQTTTGTTPTATGDGTAQVIQTIGVIAGVAVVALLVRYASRRLRERESTDVDRVATAETTLITALIVAAAGLVLLVWEDVAALEAAIDRFRPDPLFGVRVVVSLLLVAAAYGLTRVAARVVKSRDPGDGETPPSVDHRREAAFYVTQVGAYTVVGLVVLALWRVNLGNLLVGAGFLGIVVGLAARQTLGAVIAGFVLLFARPFEVGDWVVVGDREGVVTDVNVVNTQLRTFDDEHVMIPNDRVTGRDIVNRSREGRLRVTQEVGVDYEADVGHAAEVAREAIDDCEVGPLLSAPAPRVVAKRFGDSAVVLELRFWISTPTARRMWRTRTAVTEAVKEAFEREGIAIPFPQRALSGREGAPVGVEGAAGTAGEGAPPSEAAADAPSEAPATANGGIDGEDDGSEAEGSADGDESDGGSAGGDDGDEGVEGSAGGDGGNDGED